MDRHTNGTRKWKRIAATGAMAFAMVVLPAGVAGAAQYPDGGTESTAVSDPGSSVQVAGKAQTRGALPFTGGDIAALGAIGVGAVGIGSVMTVRARRRRAVVAT